METHTDVSNRTLRSKVFHVTCYKGEAGLFFATSPGIEGLLVAERSIEALMEAVPVAVVDLFKACGEDVIVTPADEEGEEHLWVSTPIALIDRERAKRLSGHA